MPINSSLPVFRSNSTNSTNATGTQASPRAGAGSQSGAPGSVASQRFTDGMDNPRTTTAAEVAANALGAKAIVGDGTNFIENLVEAQYQKHLGRPADDAGKENLSNLIKDKLEAGESPEAVSKFVESQFKNSEEYQKGPTDGLVDQTYREMLGREPDAAGKEYWQKFVDQQKADGVPTGELREKMREMFAHSEEGKPKYIAAAKDLNTSLFPDLKTAFSMYQRADGDPTQLRQELRSGIREARQADANGDGIISRREASALKSDVARWLTQSRLSGF